MVVIPQKTRMVWHREWKSQDRDGPQGFMRVRVTGEEETERMMMSLKEGR